MAVSILRKRRENYETCFNGLGLNKDFVTNIINFLRSYTFAQNKNVLQDRFATTHQAAMIYTCLYFSPDILHNQAALMRQICDLYFADNWILPIHIELSINLFEKWEPYKAAFSAISLITSKAALEHAQILSSLRIPSGLLSIEKFSRYSSLILDCNKHIQWIILHSGDENKKSKKTALFQQEIQMSTKVTEQIIFNCLLKLTRFEHKFFSTCNYLINHKEYEMNRLRRRICNVFEQTAVLLGSTAAIEGNWNERLKEWVITLKDTVSNMQLDSNDAPQILEHLRSKIDEVIELQPDDQLVFKQYFNMINTDLEKLQALCLINEEFLRRILEQTDSTYLWSTLNSWTQRIENLLKEDALALKFLLNKVAYSIGNLLANVANEDKKQTLSKFYHQKLELSLRQVIQAIPRSIFAELDKLQPLFSVDTACQIEKTNIKSLAQLERRRRLAEKTYEITKLSLGISNMQMANLGPIEIKPNALLFDGLKQELSTKLKAMISESLTDQNYLRSLDSHRVKLKTFRDAFVFVCEHIGIDGVALWQTQLAEVVYAALEAEKPRFEKTPMPNDKKNQPNKLLPYLIDALLKQTNPKKYKLLSNFKRVDRHE
ncbi:WASH complex subunit strumpellin [Aphelenchoides bicaudatus]|nr:WASH complex subunit strumpellin [Aphelenchoides bicaudatus]